LTKKCGLSATLAFESPNPERYESIVGQFFNAVPGWHVLWTPGWLYLQPDGGGDHQIVTPFTPTVGQKYALLIANEGQQVIMSIDGKVVGSSQISPLTDVSHDVVVGGLDGDNNEFVGTVSDLRITVQQ
jgi:cell wall assembly regulator SMI1